MSIRKALRKVCMLPLKFFVLFLPGIGTVIFGELGHRIVLGWILNQCKTDFWPLPLYFGRNSSFPTYYFTSNYFLFLETASSCFLCNPQHNYNNSDTAGVSSPEEGDNHIALQNVNILYHYNCLINIILVLLFCFIQDPSISSQLW